MTPTAHQKALDQLGPWAGRGASSAVELSTAALRHIEREDGDLKSWTHIDAERAMEIARNLDSLPARTPHFALKGIPIGLKDIFDVAGMPTAAGSVAYRDHRPEINSRCADRLSATGAVIVGKNATCELAGADPAESVNPWDPECTPGGSSAGSAVAVAAGMVPLAIGSQTGGSTIRPALYNGVVGFKPSQARISTQGMIPLAPSLDHVGLIGRRAAGISVLFNVLDEWGTDGARIPASGVVLGVVREFFCSEATAECVDEFERVIDVLRADGHTVQELALPQSFDDYEKARKLISCHEAARVHGTRVDRDPEGFGPFIKLHVERGRAVSSSTYEAALTTRAKFRRELNETLGESKVFLTPGTPSSAPRDRSQTGSPIFQGWTSCGVPSIGLPTGLNDKGLPLGVQLVAAFGQDNALITTAVACEKAVNFTAIPRAAARASYRKGHSDRV